MQVVRVIIWVILLVVVIIFSWSNWNPVEVTIWENLVVETKVPALVIISFLLGFLPTWLYARGVIWSLNRKIRSLEIAAKASSVSAAAREAEREEASRQQVAQTEEAEAEAEPEPEPEPDPEPESEPAPEPETDPRLTADDADGSSDDEPKKDESTPS